MHEKIERYIEKWMTQGYPEDIPDTVPDGLMEENLAPSYRQIAIAILKNDHALQSLGFAPKQSPWYYAIKRVELERRNA